MDVTEQMDESEKAVYEKFRLRYPFRIVDFINALNIKVFAETMDDSQSGAIVKEGDDYKIFFNQNHPITRIRFTLAHELGHYVYDKAYLTDHQTITDSSHQSTRSFLFRKQITPSDPTLRRMDIRANQFAAELLMPENQFVETWHQSNSPEDVALAFNVSVDAVKARAHYLLGVIA